MSSDLFNKEFDLLNFNKTYKTLNLHEDDSILKLFIKFINDEVLLKEAIINNDIGQAPPAVSFVSAYLDEFKSIFSSANDTFIETRKINTLVSHLFCEMNSGIYEKGDASDLINEFLYYPDFFVRKNVSYKDEKTMRARIENVIFETRAMIYTTSYEDMIRRFSKISTDIKDKSIYDDLLVYFSNNLFKDDEIGPDKKVIRFNKNLKMRTLLNNDAVLFLLDKNNKTVKEWFNKEKLYKRLESQLKSYDKDIYISGNQKIIDKAFEIKEKFKRQKFGYCNYYLPEKNTSEDRDQFGKKNMAVSQIDDILDVFEIIGAEDDESTFSILVCINRFGVINIILLDKLDQYASWDNDDYNADINNKLVKEASHKSKQVENRINSLAKIFNCINLNDVFAGQNHKRFIHGLAFDNDITLKEENKSNLKLENYYKNLSKQIYKKTNIFKAVFSRITYDHKTVLLKDISANLFYDVFTFFITYSHSFDKQTLFEIIKNKDDREEFKNSLSLISLYKTYQIQFDDSQFTYSIMDQYSRFIEFNNMIGEPNTAKDNMQTHKYRLYSLWDFSSLCGAIIFGTSSNLLNEMLLKYTSDNFAMNKKGKVAIFGQYRLSKIYSDINVKCNHVAYSPKARDFTLMNKVFGKMGVVEVEHKLKHIFDAAWQHANIKTGRLYSKLGLYFSLSSFLTGAIGFAWAGAIFIDFKITDIGKYTFPMLFAELFKTAKFHFVLFVAIIPFILYFLILFIEVVRNNLAFKNLCAFFVRSDKRNYIKNKEYCESNHSIKKPGIFRKNK